MPPKISSHNAQEPNAIALQLIAFLVSDGERLERFSALSGMGLGDMKSGANIDGHVRFLRKPVGRRALFDEITNILGRG